MDIVISWTNSGYLETIGCREFEREYHRLSHSFEGCEWCKDVFNAMLQLDMV